MAGSIAIVGMIGRLLGSVELLCAALAVGIAGAASVAVAMCRRSPAVAVERVAPAGEFAATVFLVELLASARRGRTPTLRIVEAGAAADVAFGLAPLERRGHRRAAYEVQAARGLCRTGPTTLEWTDWLGLVQHRKVVAAAATVMVWPRPLDAPMRLRRAALYESSDRRRNGAPVADEDADRTVLRAYADGDDLRTVHWRTSARLGELVVRDTDDQIVRRRLTAAADLRSASHSAESFETALSLIAGFAVRAATPGEPSFAWTLTTDDGRSASEKAPFAETRFAETRFVETRFVETRPLLDQLAVLSLADGSGRGGDAAGRPWLRPSVGGPADLCIAGPFTNAADFGPGAAATIRCATNGSVVESDDHGADAADVAERRVGYRRA